MNRTFGFAAAWLAGTIVAVLIGAAAVGNVRNEVTDGPTALGVQDTTIVVEEPNSDSVTLSTTPDEIVTPIQGQGNVDELPATTTTTPQVATTTTSEPDNHEVSTSSTTPPPPTSSTTPPPTTTTEAPSATTTTIASYTKTYDVEDAGTVWITVTGEDVTFAGAVPSEGWKATPKDKGPEEVEVQFENNDDDEDAVSFKAQVKDGELVVKIEEKD